MTNWNFIKPTEIDERPYQMDDFQSIVDQAKKKVNSGLVYPTGLGKTYTAFMAMDYFLTKGKVVFLADTNVLCAQHHRLACQIFNIKKKDIKQINGRTKPENRIKYWNECKIIFATPQTILNELVQENITLDGVSLFVFDEMHMAGKEYDYVHLARACMHFDIRIIGMTASTGDYDKIEQLENHFDVKWWIYHSNTSEAVADYVFDKKEEVIHIKTTADHQDQRDLALETIYDALLIVHNQVAKSGQIDRLHGDLSIKRKRPFFRMTQLNVVYEKVMHWLKHKEEEPFDWNYKVFLAAYYHLVTILNLYETEGYEVVLSYIQRKVEDRLEDKYGRPKFNTARYIWMNKKFHQFKDMIESFVNEKILHPKIFALRYLVLNMEIEGKRILVFGNDYHSLEFIQTALERNGTKTRLIAGSKHMKTGDQVAILEAFENKEFPVLLATTVIEKGIHIPDIDNLFNYSAPLTGIAHIQRGGRTGRTSVGHIHHLIVPGTADESLYWATKAANKKMDKALTSILLAQEDILKGRKPTTRGHQTAFDF